MFHISVPIAEQKLDRDVEKGDGPKRYTKPSRYPFLQAQKPMVLPSHKCTGTFSDRSAIPAYLNFGRIEARPGQKKNASDHIVKPAIGHGHAMAMAMAMATRDLGLHRSIYDSSTANACKK